MKKYFISFALLIICASFGCSTSTAKRLNRLDLGMSPAQVRNILGDNYIAEASMTDTNGERLQVWEYTDKKTQDVYRVYFKGGELAAWGPNGNLNFPVLTMPR